jgi:hypothetical protein
VSFHQGVWDIKILEKLATYEVEDVSQLSDLIDKYARAAEGWTWHTRSEPNAQGRHATSSSG